MNSAVSTHDISQHVTTNYLQGLVTRCSCCLCISGLTTTSSCPGPSSTCSLPSRHRCPGPPAATGGTRRPAPSSTRPTAPPTAGSWPGRRERKLGGGVEDGDIFVWVKDRSGWTHVRGLGSLTFKVLCYEWVNSATKEENSVYSVMKWNMRGQLRSRTEAVTARARRQTPGQRQQETTIWCCLWTDVSLSPWPASRSRPMCQCQGTASDWSADDKHWPLIGRVRVSVSIRIIVHNVLLLSGLCIHPLRTKTISLKCKI